MSGAGYSGNQPILGIDVWEHGERSARGTHLLERGPVLPDLCMQAMQATQWQCVGWSSLHCMRDHMAMC